MTDIRRPVANPPGRPRTKAPVRLDIPQQWERFEWPAELCQIARRRTEKLFGWLRWHSVGAVIESAYLQGLTDGVDAMNQMEQPAP